MKMKPRLAHLFRHQMDHNPMNHSQTPTKHLPQKPATLLPLQNKKKGQFPRRLRELPRDPNIPPRWKSNKPLMHDPFSSKISITTQT
mmetsp:Transcript_72640/g.115949  ORF Transcript_72640/g.115949 Transcript_72640/m.115949 type:complete len:87 (+) Transcript_72640:235-495(+)